MTDKSIKTIALCLIAAACVPLLFACSSAPSAEGGSLVINEVMSSNSRSLVDETLGTPDWIELYNDGTGPIDLSGYGVSDNMRKLHKFVVPEGTILDAGEYLLLYATNNTEITDPDAMVTNFGLSKSGDYIFITDAYFGLVAQMEVPQLYTDISYARAADGTYGYSGTPTPGAENRGELYVSPDAVFAAQNLDELSISEVMPTDDESGYRWVELYNGGDGAVSLENYCLSDDEANPRKWKISSGTVPAGGYVSIYLSGLGKDGKNGIHAAFRLSSEDTVILLSDLQGNVIDRLGWESGVPRGISVLQGPDGAAAYTAYPTFESANSNAAFTGLAITPMDRTDPVHLNEVLKYNTLSAIDADGDREEWVELRNFSDDYISLLGYFLSDDAEDLYKWALPDITLQPGEYKVIFLSGKDRTDGELHANFSLSDEENDIFLTSLNGMRSEGLPLADLTRENISIGLDDDFNIRYFASPTPGGENVHGFETADQIGCFDNQGVFISEVCAVQEIDDSSNDWIELCNGSGEPVDLTGWMLSDSPSDPARYIFAGGTIEPGGYFVVDCTAKPLRQDEDTAHFSISPGGETIVLLDPDGALVDTFATGALTPDVTSGRIESDPTIARVFFEKPTRGKENDSDVTTGVAPVPVISELSLYHTDPFTVTITCSDPNAEIYYTTDGSEPTLKSKRYTEPLIFKVSMPLRAVSYVSGKRMSQIVTATYLFETPHTVPVVCINGDPARIREVMRVASQKDKIEREAYISYYEPDGTLGISFPAGIKPKGAGTIVYAQKSLSINLRSGYGQSSVTYPFWPGYEFDTFSALVVRNGGQDWDNARIRDSFASALVEGLNVDNAATRPVVVYINGKYNGLYDFNEDLNGEFLQTHYGVDNDTVEFIRRNSAVIKGSNKDIKRVRSFGESKNLSDDELFAEYSQWIDVAFFTDYFIAETYMCNSDMFNQKYWRTTDYTLKWRPVFFDLDFAFLTATRDIIPFFFDPDGVPSLDQSRTYFEIYIGLKKNEAWRNYCAERYVEVVETYFNAERATALFDEMVDAIRPEMARQINKWGKPASMSAWEKEISKMRYYIQNRPENALENMRKYFGLTRDELNQLIAKYRQ